MAIVYQFSISALTILSRLVSGVRSIMRTRLLWNNVVILCLSLCFSALVLNLLKPKINSPHREENDLTNKIAIESQIRTGAKVTPLILIYNNLYHIVDWNCSWKNVEESEVIQRLTNCSTTCHFTFDKYLQRFADFVIVSVSAYEAWGGRRP